MKTSLKTLTFIKFHFWFDYFAKIMDQHQSKTNYVYITVSYSAVAFYISSMAEFETVNAHPSMRLHLMFLQNL